MASLILVKASARAWFLDSRNREETDIRQHRCHLHLVPERRGIAYEQALRYINRIVVQSKGTCQYSFVNTEASLTRCKSGSRFAIRTGRNGLTLLAGPIPDEMA